VPDYDWSRFDDLAESTVTCRCGTEYRSHATIVKEPVDGSWHGMARKPCPSCDGNRVVRIGTDPETMTL
jgi:hypothetical protein